MADSDDEEEYEEIDGGNRLLGFMFGNVDGSGDLDVDYLDEDAKEHIAALADKLGPSLKEIDLSIKSAHPPADGSEQDYDEKAEDAVDYEDFDEQYEGPEIQAVMEEHHLLPKEYFSAEISLASLDHTAPVFDEEDYDEDEDAGKENEMVEYNSEAPVSCSTVEQLELSFEKEMSPDDDLPSLGPLEEENMPTEVDNFQEEEPQGLEEPSGGKKETSLPVLCIEDGMVVLRFSEIFGVHKPLMKKEKRDHHRYSILRDGQKPMDASDSVEEDEEAFLKGSCQALLINKGSSLGQDNYAPGTDSDVELVLFDVGEGVEAMPSQIDKPRKDSCLSEQPMKEGIAEDLSARWQLPLCPKFYPLDQQDWEKDIIWEGSPQTSHESFESLVISRPDSEVFTSADLKVDPGPQTVKTDSKMELDKKDHSGFLQSRPVLVEPFGSRNFSELANLPSERSYHPQILRLESRLEMNDSHHLMIRKENGADDIGKVDAMRCLSRLSLQNNELVEGTWLDKIIWEQSESVPRPKLILDLQDDQMLFEILDTKDGRKIRSHAGSMIITRSWKSCSEDSFDLHGQGGASVGRFNISNDKYYSSRKTSQQLKSQSKKRAVHGIKVMHSVPALKLQTMKPKLTNKYIANFHRPKALWYPHDNEVAAKEQAKLFNQGPMKIILKSMGGKGSKLYVHAEETLASVKEKASKKLDFRPSEKVKIFYSGKELEECKSLAMQNVEPNSLLHLVRTKIHLWHRAQKLPGENKPLRPPGAFKRKSELSVKVGHVFLMEYCEERPLLLGNVGMGARLCTYYQKLAPGDQNSSFLQSGNNSPGTIVSLDPADKSPFIGDVRPGCSQSSLETNMYRAPIFPHKLSSTDYLLVRSAKGKLSLRRVDKLYVVGQQEPHMEVIAPESKARQTYIENRLLVYVFREFRANEKPGFLPYVRADELSAQFPYFSEIILKKKLKNCADLQIGPNGQKFWVMKRGFRIPTEEELRRMVTPENVCAFESMQAGLYRLKRLGISRLTHPAGLSSAMNQLPDEAIALAAASHIERELQITPWNLSSNFVACTNQDRENIERLEITGVGDPSGRGIGFSYVRVAPKAPVSNAVAKKKVAAARNTTLTGTDADLRRLSMDAAREVLLKFKVPEEQIEKMTRWHRIAMVRKLSSEQAASGVKVDATTLSKFARGQRMSFLQLQQQTREKCQEIWDRQVLSLSAADGDENESDSEANSDLDSFAGDLENLLDAEECEEGVEGNDESQHDKADSVRGLKIRRRPSQVQAQEEIEDEAAEAAELRRMLMDDDEAEGSKKKMARPIGKVEVGLGSQFGFRSENAVYTKIPNTIMKQVIRTPQSGGSFTSKEVIIRDPKEVESFLAKRNLSGKLKASKGDGKNDIPSGALNKKKGIGEGFKVIKDKKNTDKPVRESFVCGACGQLGHMRTNKNCPRYNDDLGIQVENMEPEKLAGKSYPLDTSTQIQQKTPAKKLIAKGLTKSTPVEISETEKLGSKLQTRILPLKLKCGVSEKLHEKNVAGRQTCEKQVTIDTETGTKSFAKVNKLIISSKTKSEETQLETPKPLVVIRPPVETERDQPRKKIIIKQPKGNNHVEQVRLAVSSGIDDGLGKAKKMVDLSSFESHKKHDKYLAEEAQRRKANEERRVWEGEEKSRYKERMREETNRRIIEEEKRMREEQHRLLELRRYEETQRREREERKKAKKKKKRLEVKDEYLEDYRTKRKDRRILERDRAAKRRSMVDLGRYAPEHAPPTKRRRGGEVALSNILERIVESLRDAKEVSYLFLKPVSKKEAPDYLNKIKHPMDLSTIREKVRRMEYKSTEDFRHDVWQITYNAHLYNDALNPSIPPLADQLLELCDYLLEENQDSLVEAQCGIE